MSVQIHGSRSGGSLEVEAAEVEVEVVVEVEAVEL